MADDEMIRALLEDEALEAEMQRRVASNSPADGGRYAPGTTQEQASYIPDGMVYNPQTGQMTERMLIKANEGMNRPKAAGVGYAQGYMLNSADEAAGAVGGPYARERLRAIDELAQEKYPGTYFAGQVSGAVTNPATRLVRGVSTLRGGAAIGAAESAIDKFNRNEGGAAERLEGVPAAATVGGLFALGGSAVQKFGGKAFNKLFRQSVKRPTLANLKSTKNAAYMAVRESGETFDQSEMKALYDRAIDIADEIDIDDAADPQTWASLKMLERRSGEESVTLDRLDRIRQTLWDRYNRGDEPAILDMISAIDDMIDTRAGSSELMSVARAANKRYSKAQLLESAFRKARLQTASTGSGGNILNKYKQAVTRIITNPKEARFFSQEEIAMMESFVEGTNAENALRRVGKLAPGGNGLMAALNLYASVVNPAMLSVSAAGQAAKTAADKSGMVGADKILDAVSTGVIQSPTPPRGVGEAAAASGVAVPEYIRNRNGL